VSRKWKGSTKKTGDAWVDAQAAEAPRNCGGSLPANMGAPPRDERKGTAATRTLDTNRVLPIVSSGG